MGFMLVLCKFWIICCCTCYTVFHRFLVGVPLNIPHIPMHGRVPGRHTEISGKYSNIEQKRRTHNDRFAIGFQRFYAGVL